MSERLAVVGDGLIGRSVRLAWERRNPDAVVDSYDRESDFAGLGSATTVVLATPVDVILALIPRLPVLAPEARLIIDTGSTKHAIAKAVRAAGLSRFVPGHPMAGGTSSGPAQARADLFDGRTWFLLDGHATDDALGRARQLVENLGARAVVMSDGGVEHDRLVAALSHVPQVVATALLARVGEAVGEEGLRYAGAGLRATTRLAASHASIWAPILATNADGVSALLRQLASDLEQVADTLGDAAAVERLFTRAHRFIPDP